MSKLYETIEGLCKSRGINITVMCKEAGVSRGNLTDLKKGRQSGLSAINLDRIASYFGVSVSYLLGTEQKEKPLINDDEELTEFLEQLRTRPECRMLFSLTKDATKADVEKAVAIIEALRKTGDK